MELRYADNADDLRGLWRAVFAGDSGDTFFTRDYTQSRSLVYSGGAVVSMLHWLIQPLSIWGREVPCAYILGVGTHPDYRGRGLAGDLVEQALFELHLRRIPLACLIPQEPSLVRFYEKYGFLQAGARMLLPDVKAGGRRASSGDAGLLNASYELSMGDRPFLKRDAERWNTIVSDYETMIFPDGSYAVSDGGVVMEASGGELRAGHPNAAMLRVVEAGTLSEYARASGLPVPDIISDDYCPWNDAGEGDGQAQSPERLWFESSPPYINLLYNGKDVSVW